MEAFPKLKDAGGYELLRSSNGRVLEEVPAPLEGYSAAYLKDVINRQRFTFGQFNNAFLLMLTLQKWFVPPRHVNYTKKTALVL